MPKQMSLSNEEAAILSKLAVEELLLLNELKHSGNLYMAILNMVNIIIDIEKNYAFALREDQDLSPKHAYSRGKAAFGIEIMRLINGAQIELSRREKIQAEIKAKQKNN